jgi:hypothetical protein
MADFCKQCSAELFGGDFNDLSGLITKEDVDKGYYMPALCEGCGPTGVDHDGMCLNPGCLKHGHKSDV